MHARETRSTRGSLTTVARTLAIVAIAAVAMATSAYTRPMTAQTTDPGGASRQASEAPNTPPRGVTALNLNTATVDELEALPGIGPATATRIFEYRQKNGPFKKIEDLMTIKGIGEKSFLKLKPLVTVAPPRAERPTN